MNRRTFLGGSAAAVGIATIGAAAFSSTGTAQDTGPQATIDALQTRVADLKTSVAKRDLKIDRLETAVANSAPPPEPTQVADPSSQFEDWQIDAVSGSYRAQVGERSNTYTAAGDYLVVQFTATNTTKAPQAFPFEKLMVLGSQDRQFSWDSDATIALYVYELNGSIHDDLQPSLPTPMAVLFDVPADAEPFILIDIRDDLNVPIVIA